MNKYLIFGGGAGLSGAVVFAAFALQAGQVGVAVRNYPPVEFDASCKTKTVNAIKSVYPSVALAKVQSWTCTRSFKDAAAPNEWRCHGEHTKTLTSAEWVAAEKAGQQFGSFVANGANWDVTRSTRNVKLNAAQKTAHAPLLGCLGGVPAGDLMSFSIYRGAEDPTDVFANVYYFGTVPSEADAAALKADGRLIRILDNP